MKHQDVCEDVPEEVCETVNEKFCRTVQEEVCDDPEYGSKEEWVKLPNKGSLLRYSCKCSVLMEEEGITVEKEQCKEEVDMDMECKTVEKQACTSVVEQVCPITIVPVSEYFA